MARIQGVPYEEATGDVRAFYDRQLERRGVISNTAYVYALRPTILQGHSALAAGIEESGLLEPALRNLVCLRAALINGCPF